MPGNDKADEGNNLGHRRSSADRNLVDPLSSRPTTTHQDGDCQRIASGFFDGLDPILPHDGPTNTPSSSASSSSASTTSLDRSSTRQGKWKQSPVDSTDGDITNLFYSALSTDIQAEEVLQDEGDTVQLAPLAATVGLINEGCTCYLNALLQLLFHTCYFRSCVYQMPVEGNERSVHRALQDLFFQMQERTTPARVKKLTDAFGWGEQELFFQHDIQEMATLLRDNLEQRMKGTVTEGAVNQLFEGIGEQFVETLDKSFISRSRDIFYDIHLPLSDVTTLMGSLESLTSRDQLIDDNKYRVEQEDGTVEYKDAEKGYEFKRFPPVIWFHLKRFAMDFTSPSLEMRKVNSRLEFPVSLDLSSMEKGLTEGEAECIAAKTKRGEAVQSFFNSNTHPSYDLLGVIVHRGTVRSGHYYCYIHNWDAEKEQFTHWLEYDDERVRVVDEDVAVRSNYGGHSNFDDGVRAFGREPPTLTGHNTSAYILCYVRRGDAPRVLAPSPTDIITQRVKEALRTELREEEERQCREAELRERMTLYISGDEGLERFCQENQQELLPRSIRGLQEKSDCVLECKRTDSLLSVYEKIEQKSELLLGIAPVGCRFWIWLSGASPPTPLPTYAEATTLKDNLLAYLPISDGQHPQKLLIYLQTVVSLPRCIADSSAAVATATLATDYFPFIELFKVEERERCSIVLKQPTVVRGLHLLLDIRSDRPVEVTLTIWVNGIQLPSEQHVELFEASIYIPATEAAPVKQISIQCRVEDRPIHIVAAHFEVAAAVTAAFTPHPALVDGKQALSLTGYDRILVFIKYFDHATCSLRYLGSTLVDRIAVLYSLEPLIYQMTGVSPTVEAISVASTGLSPRFMYFEQQRDGVRNLHTSADLAQCKVECGAVIIAQLRDVAPVYRHSCVDTYLRSLRDTVDVQLTELTRVVHDNVKEFRKSVELYRKVASVLMDSTGSGSTSSRTENAVVEPSPPCGPSHAKPTGDLTPPPHSSETANTGQNPYSYTLPILNDAVEEVAQSTYCPMDLMWELPTVYDRIGQAAGHDPSCIQLNRYASSNNGSPQPSSIPMSLPPRATLSTVLDQSGTFGQSMVYPLYWERRRAPRGLPVRSFETVITLRDSLGHALHSERYTIDATTSTSSLFRSRGISSQDLVTKVLRSVQPWEVEHNGPWGTTAETLASTHFVLVAFPRHRPVIYHIVEVDLSDKAADFVEDETGEPLSFDAFDWDLIPMAPLEPFEQRIACCHAEHRHSETTPFGVPFVITINRSTTVHEATEMMCNATNMLADELNNVEKQGVMMLTETAKHFTYWDQEVHLFWLHTPNKSGHIPSLMLNHSRPREKPGSRYVAHHNPKLKIGA